MRRGGQFSMPPEPTDDGNQDKVSMHNNSNYRRGGQQIRNLRTIFGLLTLSLLAAATASAGDTGRGKELSATCAACHGADGNSVNPEWPSLAGQHETYLVRSIKSFRDGERDNVLMSPQASALSDQDIDDLAAYFSDQTPQRRAADPALVTQGERLYRGGDKDKSVSACMACHGPNGHGNPGSGYPALAGQHATYTANQLMAYRTNARQSDASVNQIMRNISALMSDEDIKAVSSYVQGLQ
jgi:cytochrome c553